MADQIRFDDGAAYERMMGVWSRLVGNAFLDWLAPAPGLRWIDVGCGGGAFTELLVERAAPAEVQGVDPSEAQLAFARTRPAGRKAEFLLGDARDLPFPDCRFDAAVMALAIFFVPEPDKGVAEMLRVTRPGGTVATYAWDIAGGGLPMEPLQAEMHALGHTPLQPPSADVARLDALRTLWERAGLEEVATREIAVTRAFPDFEAFWMNMMNLGNLRAAIEAMPTAEAERLKAGTSARMPAAADGTVTVSARANAVRGRVPG